MGSWNSGYQAVYQLSFSGVRVPGRYQVKLLSPASAASPTFTIGDGSQLYRQLVDNAVRYFTSERDGPDVNSAVLDRQPANLTDENAYVYADPKYDGRDNLLGTLQKVGGPVDVSGGWFDAGGGYTDAFYRKYGGSRQYEAFAQQQVNFALGANGWGTSFVVGAGTVSPHCMQSEIANLAGSLSGTGDIQLGRHHRRAERPG